MDEGVVNPLQGFLPGREFFPSNARLPDKQLGVESAAVSDYNRLYEAWYLNTNGDSDLAAKQADRAFKATWGATSINGQTKQLTKYPIEKAYGKEYGGYLEPDEIRNALISDVKSVPKYKDLEDDDIFLQYDHITAREWGSKNGYPTYKVLIRNKQGVIEPLPEPELDRWAPQRLKDKTQSQESKGLEIRQNKFGK